MLIRLRRTAARHFTLGGTLSIANGLCWVCFMAGIRHLPEWAIAAVFPLMLLLALPVGVFCLTPTHTGGPSVVEIVVTAIGMGVNSLLWGHGLAWIIHRVGERFGRNRPMSDVVDDHPTT